MKENEQLHIIIGKASEYGEKVHAAAGCKYGDNKEFPYTVHLNDVHDWVVKHREVFKFLVDQIHVEAAAFTHDTIEDAQQTYNNVKDATNTDIADITLNVTDVHAKNRMLRFLSTAPKILSDPRSYILKLCDLGANSSFGREAKNNMYRKYQKEWVGYKRYIFVSARYWYEDRLIVSEIDKLIANIDKVVGYIP